MTVGVVIASIFLIPLLAIIFALVGLIITIKSLRKEGKNKSHSIVCIVICDIVIVLGLAYIITNVVAGLNDTKYLSEYNTNDKLLTKYSATQIIIQDLTDYFVYCNTGSRGYTDELKKDVLKKYIIGDEAKNIVYDSTTSDKAYKGKIALKDSGKTYYYLKSDLASALSINGDFVVDDQGQLYINIDFDSPFYNFFYGPWDIY